MKLTKTQVYKIEFYNNSNEHIGSVYYYASNSEEAYNKAKYDYSHAYYDVIEIEEQEVLSWNEVINS